LRRRSRTWREATSAADDASIEDIRSAGSINLPQNYEPDGPWYQGTGPDLGLAHEYERLPSLLSIPFRPHCSTTRLAAADAVSRRSTTKTSSPIYSSLRLPHHPRPRRPRLQALARHVSGGAFLRRFRELPSAPPPRLAHRG
jgi:hypothetical protein